jgi:hypothetical protein
MQLARVENRLRRFDSRNHERLGKRLLAEQPVQRRVSRYEPCDGLCLRFEFDVGEMRDLGRRGDRLLAARGRHEHTGDEKDDTSLHRSRAV